MYLFKCSLLYRLFIFIIKRREIQSFFTEHYPSMDKRIYKKIRNAFILQNLGWGDFYRLGCERLTLRQMNNLLSYRVYTLFYNRFNSRRATKLLCEKRRTYNYYQDAFHRQVEFISSEDIKNRIAKTKFIRFNNSINTLWLYVCVVV